MSLASFGLVEDFAGMNFVILALVGDFAGIFS